MLAPTSGLIVINPRLTWRLRRTCAPSRTKAIASPWTGGCSAAQPRDDLSGRQRVVMDLHSPFRALSADLSADLVSFSPQSLAFGFCFQRTLFPTLPTHPLLFYR